MEVLENFIKNNINTIKQLEKRMVVNGFKFCEIVENSRDGGYVSYSNWLGTKIVYFTFLPDYDIQVVHQKNLLKFLFTKDKRDDFISYQELLGSKIEFDTRKQFFEEGLNFMIANGYI